MQGMNIKNHEYVCMEIYELKDRAVRSERTFISRRCTKITGRIVCTSTSTSTGNTLPTANHTQA